MKKVLLIISLLHMAYTVVAQDYKLFIDNNGKPTMSFASATSYIDVKQLADSLWQMQQYDMQGDTLQSGIFKDRNLQIPNGKAIYYRKLDFYNSQQMKEWIGSDTANWITGEGEFKDGKKDGEWILYFANGKIREESHYKDGLLNGPYRSYNDDRNTIGLLGNYVNGKRDGNWEIFNLEGKVIEIDKYRYGIMRSRKISPDSYNPATPSYYFENYIAGALRKSIKSQNIENTSITYIIVFTITKHGKIVHPRDAVPRQHDDPLARMLFGIIEDSPEWTPANIGGTAKPVEDFAAISVGINQGIVTAKLLDNAEVKKIYYNLTH